MIRTNLVVLIGSVVLLLPAAINGSPLFYFDSAAYIEIFAKAVAKLQLLLGVEAGVSPDVAPAPASVGARPDRPFGHAQDDGAVYSGRSIYYGALAYLGWITTLWLPVLVQCLAASGLIVAIFRLLVPESWVRASLASIAVLTFASSLGYFSDLVTPDIWAGLAILALALLWSAPQRLSRGSLLVLLAILSFSALAHQSHLALIAVMIAGGVAVHLLFSPRIRQPLQALTIPVLALLVGVAGQVAFTKAVIFAYDQPPVARPMITAHLVDLGPGAAYARASCPESGYVICDYVDRLPTDWISFLFSPSDKIGVFATGDPQTQRDLAAEQIEFAIGTLAFDPLETVGGLMGEGLKQFVTLSLTDVAITRRQSGFLDRNFPPDVAARIRSSRIYTRPHLVPLMTQVLEVTTAASAMVLLVWLARRRRTQMPDMLAGIVLVCLTGFAANALICGILASPYGRFQARVAWLLPLAVLFIASVRHTRNLSMRSTR